MKLIALNLKMNLLPEDVDKYIDDIKEKNLDNVIFFPSYIYIDKFNENNLIVGSQDLSFASSGEYTGDVSILQLKSLGIKYSLVGHSERRKYYDDERYINKKVSLCLENDVTPILCIGESLKDRDNNNSYHACIEQIDRALIGLNNLDNLIIAYEPVWAIGSGIIPTNEYIDEIIDKIKKYVYNKYGKEIRVLYGGSVNIDNIAKLMTLNNVDGFLIGGSSIKTEAIKKIIDIVKGV